jgi:photosynthetic reaction center M subunit
MTYYQNIFTQLQVAPHPEPGIPLPTGESDRRGTPFFSYWAGKIGDAQIGPIYLGTLGFISLVCGIVAIEIIGLNMLFASYRISHLNHRSRNTASEFRRSKKAVGG